MSAYLALVTGGFIILSNIKKIKKKYVYSGQLFGSACYTLNIILQYEHEKILVRANTLSKL